jgi:hypothetical protein
MCASLETLYWALRIFWALVVIQTAAVWLLYALARLRKVLRP